MNTPRSKSLGGNDYDDDDGTSIPVADDDNEITYLITIGIDEYLSSHVKDFSDNCKRDSEDILKTLEGKYERISLFKHLFDQEATLVNIEKAIKSFRLDTDKNNIGHNLIIFFSGHGDVLPDRTGCWIPHGMTAFDLDEVMGFDRLHSILKNLRNKHILLIIDSCKSGKILDGLAPTTKHRENPPSGVPARSCHAAASSLSNEDSKAGSAGKNSLFTAEVLKGLNNNVKGVLSTKDLFNAITISDLDVAQQPNFERIYVENIDYNVSHLNLKLRGGGKEIKKFLPKMLHALNYVPQNAALFDIDQDADILLLTFTGSVEDGLRFLAKKAKESVDIDVDALCKSAKLSAYSSTPSLHVEHIFSTALSLNSEMGELSLQVGNLLENQSIFLEITCSAENALPAELKSDFFLALIEFLSLIPLSDESFKLVVFLIDEESHGYLYTNVPSAGMQIINLPAISSLQANEVKSWYQSVQSGFDSSEKATFKKLFEQKISKKFIESIDSSGIPPGKAIREICNMFSCSELANELLN